MCDCYLNEGNQYFRYHAGGIVIIDGKILFVKNHNGNYYYMLGGGVHLGETSAKCAEREIAEETGIISQAERLSSIVENFFEENGNSHHNLEYYYIMKIIDAGKIKTSTDIGEELVFLPLDRLSEYDIKPAFIKNNINQMINGSEIIHVIAN